MQPGADTTCHYHTSGAKTVPAPAALNQLNWSLNETTSPIITRDGELKFMEPKSAAVFFRVLV